GRRPTRPGRLVIADDIAFGLPLGPPGCQVGADDMGEDEPIGDIGRDQDREQEQRDDNQRTAAHGGGYYPPGRGGGRGFCRTSGHMGEGACRLAPPRLPPVRQLPMSDLASNPASTSVPGRRRPPAADLLRAREIKLPPGAGFWVFAYGSLMWRPGFDYLEARPALLRGYHRAFCITSIHYRGSVDCPGLVLGLDRGGSC